MMGCRGGRWSICKLSFFLLTIGANIILVAAFNPTEEFPKIRNPVNGVIGGFDDGNQDSLLSQISDDISTSAPVEGIRELIRRKMRKYRTEVAEALDLPSIDPIDNSVDVVVNSRGVNEIEDPSADAEGPLKRTKRATITADNPQLLGRQRRNKIPNPDEKGGYVIRSVFRPSPQFFDHVRTLDINAVVIRNQTYMFTLERTASGKTEIGIYVVVTSLNPKQILRVEAPGAISLEVIQIGKFYYILPLVYNWNGNKNGTEDIMDVGSNLYRVDLYQRTLDKVQTIRTAYARASVFWKGSGEEANDIYLAVAPEYTEGPKGKRYAVQVPCYRWQGGYFDYVSSVPAFNPQGIRHFNMLSHDYLVISNYQDDTGSTNVHSEVFKYYHKESRFIPFQRIRTYGAKDIQHFEFRSGQRVEHFLAVANHCQRDENGKPDYRVKSFIMKFASQRFIPFKTFYTTGALKFLPVTLEDKFYLVLVEITGIRIFQYSGWTFVQTYSSALPEMGLPFYSLNLRSYQYENQPYFAVSSIAENFQGGVYSVQFDQRNDYSKLTSSLEKWCLAAKAQMDRINITELEEGVRIAPKAQDSEIFLSQPLTFQGPLRVSNLYAKTMKYRGISFNSELVKWLTEKWAHLRQLQKSVSELEEEMNLVVFRNKDHIISGKIKFGDLQFNGKELKTKEAKVDYFNGINTQKLLEKVIYRNQDYHFSSLKIDSIKVKDELEIKTLNGSPLSDYAVKNSQSELVFTKKNVFMEEITSTLGFKVTGLLDGVDFHKPTFLLAQGNQTFEGLVYVKNCSSRDLYTKYLNGYLVDYYFQDAVPLIGNAVITGSKKFQEISVTDLEAEGLVNGFNLDSLLENAIRTTGREYQTLDGRIQFQHLVTNEVKLKNNLVNGKLDLEKEFVNIHSGTYDLKEITLTDDTFIKTLTIQKNLNRISVNEQGELDVLLKSSSKVQRVKNKKLLGLSFKKDVEADNLVDGVNLKDWTPERRILLKNTNIYPNYTIKGNLSVPKGIHVRSRFRQGYSNPDILTILKYIALLNSTRLPGSCTLDFESLNVEGNTEIRRDVNGMKPSSWVNKNYNGTYTISGTKGFLGEVTLEEDCVAKGLFGSKEPSAENILKAIPNLLLNGVDQVIYGDTAFTQLLQVDNLQCPGVVLDSVPFENLMLRRGDQTVDVATHFEGDVQITGSITVKKNVEVESVNGVKLTEAIKDTLRTESASGTQVIQGEYSFDGGIYADHWETDGLIGGHDLGQLFSSIVRKDRKEPLLLLDSSITFKKQVQLKDLEYRGEMNEIKDSDWGNLWLLTDGNQTVYTPVRFLDKLIVDEGLYVVNGLVGDLDVMRMNKEILRRDKGGYLGNVKFLQEVEVKNSIEMDPGATVNKIDLRKDVLLRNRGNSSKYSPMEQVVTGEKIFKAGWTIDGNLISKEIDGKNLERFFEFLFDKDKKGFHNDTLVVEGNLKLTYEPNVTYSVDGLNWKEILKDVWFINKDAEIKHKVHFNEIKLAGGGYFSNSESKLSGLNLKELQDKYVSKTKNQTFSGNLEFKGGVDFKDLELQDLLLNGYLFKGINLKEFLNSILTNGTDQVFHGVVSAEKLNTNYLNLEPGVLINGVNVSEDLMTLHGPNRVTGKKDIGHLTVEKLKLGPETLLAGVNITDWYLRAVKTVGNNEIEEPLIFENFEDYEDMTVTGLVDGVKYDRDHVLLKNGSQTIEGKMRITSSGGETAALTAPHGIIVDGLFNNYDLNKTFSSLVLKSEYENDTSPLVIDGRKVILAPIQVDHFRAEKLYQGHNLTQLLADFYSGLIIPSNLTFKARERYDALTDFTKHVTQISARRAVFLEYFVLTQEILEETLYTTMRYGTRSPTLVSGYQKSATIVSEKWWAYSLTTDYFQRQLGDRINIQGRVVDIKEVESDYGYFTIISVSSINNQPPQLTLPVKPSATHYEINKRSGSSKTFVLKTFDVGTASEASVISQVIYGKDFGPLESFVIIDGQREEECILVITLHHSGKNYRSGSGDILRLEASGVFVPVQSIPLQNPKLTASMIAMNTTFLMIGNGGEEEESEGVIEIWTYSSGYKLFKKETCIPVYNLVSMDAVLGSNINQFLAVASGAVPSSRYFGSVFIYKYSTLKREFEKTQTLEIDFPLQVKLLTTAPSTEVFLFVLTNNIMDNVLVYKYQGLSGWTLDHKWTSEGGLSIELADFEMEGIYKAQVIVTSLNMTRIYTAEFKGLSARPYPNPTEIDSLES